MTPEEKQVMENEILMLLEDRPHGLCLATILHRLANHCGHTGAESYDDGDVKNCLRRLVRRDRVEKYVKCRGWYCVAYYTIYRLDHGPALSGRA